MVSYILACLGLLIMVCAIILYNNKRNLYKFGIRTIGKVVGIETYTYLTQGLEFSSLYYIGITPIIEVFDGEKKIRVPYTSIDDYSTLKEGDEVEVIYLKGKIEDLLIYNEKELYKGPILVALVGVLIVVLSIILLFI
ncbi:MAG: hypothetical protein ACRDA5_15340 [Clostridium sp.]